MIVNSGVSAFKIPARVLVIRVSAIQNKKAGMKLPANPETKMRRYNFFGILRNACKAKGNKTIPALRIRIEATWYGVRDFIPYFIRMNELPQIKESTTKSNQPTNLFNRKFCQYSF